jgi:hypothetical protein
VREPERDPESAAAPEPGVTAISDAERAHRADVYREYLRSQGLTPLSEVPLASGPAAGTPATTE